MTAQEIREKYFVPGSPVIMCRREEPIIGDFRTGARDVESDQAIELPHTFLRHASFEEFMQTLKPEFHEFVRQNMDPSYRYFVEVSVD